MLKTQHESNIVKIGISQIGFFEAFLHDFILYYSKNISEKINSLQFFKAFERHFYIIYILNPWTEYFSEYSYEKKYNFCDEDSVRCNWVGKF